MILIVDDDNAVRLSIGLMLKQASLEWEAVGSEADMLAAIRAREPEVVILDMNLTLTTTGQQGLELLRKIKVLAPECDVLLISAWGTIPLAVQGMSLGAVDFITKPWRNADLLAKIRAILARRDKQRQQASPTLDELERNAVVDGRMVKNLCER